MPFGYEFAYAFGRDFGEDKRSIVDSIKEALSSLKAKGGSSNSSYYKNLYDQQVAVTNAVKAENEKKEAQEDAVIESDDEETGTGTALTGSQGAIVNAKNKKQTTLLGA